MKSLIKCPHSGQASTKRLLSLIFGLVSVILSILYVFVDMDTIVAEKLPGVIGGFILICGGLQGLTTNSPWGNSKGLNKNE